MRRKYLLIVVLVMLFQVFVPNFLRVEANDANTGQPEVCSGPSEMMSNYFNFQNEAISILLKSKVDERFLNVSFGSGGIFSKEVLGLSAIDLLKSSLESITSSASNLLTSAVLLLLVSSSVVQSNIGGLAILFKDRPIVRDYKEMLDIETQLFDVAYFRSKKINITRPLEGDLFNELNELIKKYQKIGLLEEGSDLSNNTSMADVLSDLLLMNAAMKKFIMVGGGLGTYYGCLGTYNKDDCNESTFVLKFRQVAIEQLNNDYKDALSFSACNPYKDLLTSSINKSVSNGKESVNASVQDIKNSMDNLWEALVGKGRWSFKSNRKNMCEGISDYEMAQLRAYWGPDWTCGEGLNTSLDLGDIPSVLSEIKEYFRERKAKKEQEEKLDRSTYIIEKDFLSKLQSWSPTSEKKQQWYEIYGSGTDYSPKFSWDLNSGFEKIYGEIMGQYGQSSNNAISSDISGLLGQGVGILKQMDPVINKAGDLETVLQKIVDKQCSS